MSIHIKMLLGVSVAIALGFAPIHSAAQSTGPAALAAKQQIKAQVLSAMADGNITQVERRNIFLNAKNVCTAKEYVGLVETINRLSPPDHATSENLGYAPFTDKQLMAQFPTVDLSWIAKSPASKVIPKQFILKDTLPKQNVVVRETITKQTIVKETIPQQSIAKTTIPKKTTTKETKSQQTIVKTTKPNASSNVVIVPPPPQQKNDKQPNLSTVSKAQNMIAESDKLTPPMPPALQFQTRITKAVKPVREKVADSPKKRLVTGDQAVIQQPAQLLNEGEKTSIKHSYTDYSVPVLTTPAAALLLSGCKSDAIKASFEHPLEPEAPQSIIRQ